MKARDVLLLICIVVLAFVAGTRFAITHQQITVDPESETVYSALWGDIDEFNLDYVQAAAF